MKKLVLISMIVLLSCGLFAERKALVIGNSIYDGMTLASPINDSNSMANVLGSWGFTVSKRQNLDLSRMTAVVDSFAAKLKADDEVFFYYSGHGTFESAENYLVPSGVNMMNRQTYAKTAYSWRKLAGKLSKAKSTIILLEASRNWVQPTTSLPKYFGQYATSDSTVSVITSAPPSSTVAEQNPTQSTFTQTFIQKFSQSDAPFNQTFAALQAELKAASKKSVSPWISNPLKYDLLLNQVAQKYHFKGLPQDIEGGGSLSW